MKGMIECLYGQVPGRHFVLREAAFCLGMDTLGGLLDEGVYSI
jgi:hypothetical protein